MGKDTDIDLPEAPDPEQLIRRQASVNRVNQITPFGNVSFTGPDRSTLEFNLPPELQALFQTQAGAGANVVGRGAQLLDRTGFSPISTPNVDQITKSIYDLGASRLRPEFDTRRTNLQNDLTNAGHPATGTDLAPGAVSELDVLGRQENDAFGNLALSSAIAAPQYQGQLIGNQVAQQNANIMGPLALMGGSPINVPQFNFQGATPVDVNGAYGLNLNTQMQNAQVAQQNRSDLFGGLFDLGTAAMSFYNPAAGLAMAGVR